MKKLLISIFMVATMALTGVVAVVPTINNQRAYAAPTPAETWKTNHATLLAKEVGDITLADGAEVIAALEGYDNLSDADKATVATEYAHLLELSYQYKKLKWLDDHSNILDKTVENIAVSDSPALQAAINGLSILPNEVKQKLTTEKAHLDKLNTKVSQLKWEQNHAAILAKTEANVVDADWTAISNAFTGYETLFNDYGYENISYANNKMDYLVKLTRKIASPEAVAVADKYTYFKEMPLEDVTVDNVVDYISLQKEMGTLSDPDKASLMIFRIYPRVYKLTDAVNQQYPEAIPPGNAEGDAKDNFFIALTPSIPDVNKLRINKIALANSQATKMTGVKQKDIVWSLNIELLDKNDKLVPTITKPMRIYLKITDQKMIDLIKANKIEMVHVHKKTDGTFETMKKPFVFIKRHNVIAFNADKFSEFALVKKQAKKQKGPELANTGISQYSIMGLAVLIIGLGLVATARFAKQ